ncbi:MAG: glycosyltransferase [Planctomycetes bacterium]|nr:glycosyltransferase [Planctomycetota bacterium]
MLSKVSVIIPLYNYERYIGQAIDSVLSQTYTNWEIIVVDDFSSDGGLVVVGRYEDSLKEKLRVIENFENLGVSKSRNLGFRISTGDYIAYLDADDYWEPTKLEKQVLAMEEQDAGVVHTGVNTIISQETATWVGKPGRGIFGTSPAKGYWDSFWNEKLLAQLRKRTHFGILSDGDPICSSSIMVKREVVEAVGGFDEDLLYQHEDWVFLLKCSYYYVFYMLKDRLTNYRIHKEGYTAKALLTPGGDWSADVALGQARDRCFSFVKGRGQSLSYKEFNANPTLRQKIKRHLLLPGKVKAHLIVRAKNFYHYYEDWLPSRKNESSVDLMILFLTDKCNLSCKACFYKGKLHTYGDMDIVNVRSIHRSVTPNNVLLTGGEPFLYDRIQDAINMFSEKSNVWINTNGMRPLAVKGMMAKILVAKHKTITVSVSLDGFEKTHNEMRGNDKSYSRAMDTLRVLLSFKPTDKGLNVCINTLITPGTMDKLVDFAKEMAYAFPSLDYHNFEVERSFRGFKYHVSLDGMYKGLLEVIKKNYFSYYLLTKRRFNVQYLNSTIGKPWDFPCLAGKKAFTIYPDGKLVACEMRDTVTDLAYYNYDVTKALNGSSMKQELKYIKRDKCYCAHGCWVVTSMCDHFSKVGWR